MNNEWDGTALKTLIAERKAIKQRQEQLPTPDVIFDDTPQQLVSPPFNKGRRLQPGEILVTPAWTPLFLNAAAIVMETGGYLSHGSIVAREYGIPAVVNVAGVFSAIKDGKQIKVDGNQGLVEKK